MHLLSPTGKKAPHIGLAEALDRFPHCQIPESRKAKILSDLKLQKGRTRFQAHPVFFAMLYEYSLPAEGRRKPSFPISLPALSWQ